MLEVGSGPQVPTFRNSTYLDLRVGLTRDLGAHHFEILQQHFSNQMEKTSISTNNPSHGNEFTKMLS